MQIVLWGNFQIRNFLSTIENYGLNFQFFPKILKKPKNLLEIHCFKSYTWKFFEITVKLIYNFSLIKIYIMFNNCVRWTNNKYWLCWMFKSALIQTNIIQFFSSQSQSTSSYFRKTFEKIVKFFSLRPNPDKLKMSKKLILSTDLRFRTHDNSELPAVLHKGSIESFVLEKHFLFQRNNRFSFFFWNPDKSKTEKIVLNFNISLYSNSYFWISFGSISSKKSVNQQFFICRLVFALNFNKQHSFHNRPKMPKDVLVIVILSICKLIIL